MPLGELACIPLVAEGTLPMTTAVPTLIGIESAAKHVALGNLMQKIRVGRGIVVGPRLLPPDSSAPGQSLQEGRSVIHAPDTSATMAA
jgi:hypothetical protein